MTTAGLGGLLALLGSVGLLLVGTGLVHRRRPRLAERVAPYVLDLPVARGTPTQRRPSHDALDAASEVFGPSLRRLAEMLERVLGGSASVRRRLHRSGSNLAVEEFRISQVQWGLAGVAAATALGLLFSLRSPVSLLPMLLCCGSAFVAGVLLRDQALSAAVKRTEQRKVDEFPAVADLLALSVAAGEGPVAALERVVAVSHGELSRDLRRLLGEVRTGVPVSRALDAYAATTGIPVIARFAEGLAVALERGTPLVDILHAQAADVREAGRRQLIESGARKEVLMMIPVVFLILPVTVVFAFYPGVIGLSLTSP